MKINILALGQSINEYKPSNDITIGVNDIYQHYPVDNLVIVDLPSRFSPTRLDTIVKSTPKKFFTFLPEWNGLVQNLQQIKLDKFPGCLDGLDNKDVVCYSNNSAYVAAVIAYKMGAKEIVLYGVDFVNHTFLSEKEILRKQIFHFNNLAHALKFRGVSLSVCSNYSTLTEVLPIGK